MKLTPEEYYDEYMRVLDRGSLEEMEALDEAWQDDDEYLKAMLKACKDYNEKHGLKEPSPEVMREMKLRFYTLTRRIFMGLKPRTGLNNTPLNRNTMFANVDPETGEFTGYVVHPNGRKIKIIDCGVTESDTGAFVHSPGYPSFEWDESGEELTADELNEVIEDDGDKSYLHEWLFDHAEWE